MNEKLVELADINDKAPLMLFGDHFAKEAKDRQALDRAVDCPQFNRPQNFKTVAVTVSTEGAA